jgi:hypothetical protein
MTGTFTDRLHIPMGEDFSLGQCYGFKLRGDGNGTHTVFTH